LQNLRKTKPQWVAALAFQLEASMCLLKGDLIKFNQLIGKAHALYLESGMTAHAEATRLREKKDDKLQFLGVANPSRFAVFLNPMNNINNNLGGNEP
jgi:hypothetical protein